MKERSANADLMFIANHQSPKVCDPGDASFHLPAALVSPQLPPVLGRRLDAVGLVRADQVDASPLQPFSQRIRIGDVIVDQPLRLAPGTAATPGDFDLLQRGLDPRGLVRGRTGKLNSQRKTLAACHPHPLCTLSAFGFSDAVPPFFAGAKLPSAKVSSQSSRPCSSRSPRNFRQISSQTPCPSQSSSRGRQVLGEGYWLGRSFQRAPLRRTQRMPWKHRRLSAGGRPPRVEILALGNRGSIFFHCSSVSSESCLDMKRTPFHVGLKHKCAGSAN